LAVSLDVDFDGRVFSLDSVKKAAYRFIDKFSVDIKLSENQILCSLKFSQNISPEGAAFLLDDFKREVLDQDLRATIASETEGVRNLVLAHAFSRTSLVTSNG
jgi:His-Xaa-Ser system protein HxsD